MKPSNKIYNSNLTDTQLSITGSLKYVTMLLMWVSIILFLKYGADNKTLVISAVIVGVLAIYFYILHRRLKKCVHDEITDHITGYIKQRWFGCVYLIYTYKEKHRIVFDTDLLSNCKQYTLVTLVFYKVGKVVYTAAQGGYDPELREFNANLSQYKAFEKYK